MKDKLIGDDATIARTLEKIELAVRRTRDRTTNPEICFDILAEEIARVIKDMYR